MRSLARALPLLLLAGCPYITEAEYEAVADADGDGLRDAFLGGTDCDDADATIGAAWSYYADGDGDGFGAGPVLGVACVLPAESSARADDCDDGDAAVHPEADELCATPGVDDDCDGAVDGDDPGTTDLAAWYPDADGDGQGAAAEAVYACEAPDGHGEGGSDCDDGDATVYEGAAELPFDEVDNDCNGTVDERELIGAGPFVGHVEGVLSPDLGHGVATLDLDADGDLEVVLGAPGSSTVFGFDAETIVAGSHEDMIEVTTAPWEQQDGRSLAGARLGSGDFDGDGTTDLLISAIGGDETDGGYSPSLGIAHGPVGDGAFFTDLVLEGEGATSVFGAALQVADFDGDGNDDVLAGAPQEAEWCGAAYLVYGPVPDAGAVHNLVYEGGTEPGGVKFVDPCDTSDGLYSRGQLGTAVAVVPRADARPAVALGAPAAEDSRDDQGAVFIIDEAPAPFDPVDLEVGAGRGILGLVGGEYLGTAIAAGDVDGSGHTDLVVGAMFADGEGDDNGAVYVFYDVLESEAEWIGAEDADVTLLGNKRSAYDQATNLGASVALPGDHDGDGNDDLVVGAPGELGATGETYAGAAYVIRGPLPGGRSVIAEVGQAYYGAHASMFAGWTVNALGDLDGDGTGDIGVGAPGMTDGSGGVTGGMVFLLGADF
ncbi:MAG: FG-GAP repeat protein [Deltaproteobacteria bacterium]|nr:FG-GAP repeat protein [Deltaproteobacteria bacterium]